VRPAPATFAASDTCTVLREAAVYVFAVTVQLPFNPSCSKCRSAPALLAERGVEAEEVRYLDRPLTVLELRSLMVMLGIEDPRSMMRTGEQVYRDLALADQSGEQLLDAIVADPILLERPILGVGDRAVVARPPERVLELLSLSRRRRRQSRRVDRHDSGQPPRATGGSG
jgi:arsenate reductase (glutaredoxin)